MRKYAKPIRRAMTAEHQWGLSMPGAREGLCHWRGTVEDMAKAGAQLGPIIIVDIDQVKLL